MNAFPVAAAARLTLALLSPQVWSRSTGVCPTCCPAGPLLSILCACLPFLDHGQNYAHTQVRSRCSLEWVPCQGDVRVTLSPNPGHQRLPSPPPACHCEQRAGHCRESTPEGHCERRKSDLSGRWYSQPVRTPPLLTLSMLACSRYKLCWVSRHGMELPALGGSKLDENSHTDGSASPANAAVKAPPAAAKPTENECVLCAVRRAIARG